MRSVQLARELTWRAGPERPTVADGAVEVWIADLDGAGDHLVDDLDDGERARAERMLRPADRRRWSRARGLLRALLGRYLCRPPSWLSLVLDAHGKPRLEDEALRFSVSHSGRLALYAFSRSLEVGVDIEARRSILDPAALAGRVFGAREAERLRGLSPERAREDFLRAWVAHEAALKCTGAGLARPARTQGLWIRELDLGDTRARAAVAAPRPPLELRCWRWPEPA
jgi:4'-phosphopantetheinyl transferase